MTRTHRLLLAGALACACAPASAQPDPTDAVRELQRFVRANGATVAVYGTLRAETRLQVGGIRGCSVELNSATDMRLLRQTSRHRVDLGRLSPVVALKPITRAPQLRNLELVPTSGQEEIPTSITIGRASSDSQQWRILLQFDAAQADDAARHFAEAIRACGGREAGPEVLALLADKRLRAEGNDPETFPLKGRCREMVTALVPAGSAFTADSSFTVLRLTRSARLDVSGNLQEGESIGRRFTCSFRREGDQWIPDGANLARSATEPQGS